MFESRYGLWIHVANNPSKLHMKLIISSLLHRDILLSSQSSDISSYFYRDMDSDHMLQQILTSCSIDWSQKPSNRMKVAKRTRQSGRRHRVGGLHLHVLSHGCSCCWYCVDCSNRYFKMLQRQQWIGSRSSSSIKAKSLTYWRALWRLQSSRRLQSPPGIRCRVSPVIDPPSAVLKLSSSKWRKVVLETLPTTNYYTICWNHVESTWG